MNPQPSTLNPQPSIRLHIERLVLDGLPGADSHGAQIQAVLESELTHLLAERGLNGVSSGAVSYLSGGSIQLGKDTQPARLGRQIAQAIQTVLKPTTCAPGVASAREGTK